MLSGALGSSWVWGPVAFFSSELQAEHDSTAWSADLLNTSL